MSHYYKLNPDHSTELCDSIEEWSELTEKLRSEDKRHVAKETYLGHYISTVFLSLDYNFKGYGPPILFETMVFDPVIEGRDIYVDRYHTWEEAEAGHETAKLWLKNHLNSKEQEEIIDDIEFKLMLTEGSYEDAELIVEASSAQYDCSRALSIKSTPILFGVMKTLHKLLSEEIRSKNEPHSL